MTNSRKVRWARAIWGRRRYQPIACVFGQRRLYSSFLLSSLRIAIFSFRHRSETKYDLKAKHLMPRLRWTIYYWSLLWVTRNWLRQFLCFCNDQRSETVRQIDFLRVTNFVLNNPHEAGFTLEIGALRQPSRHLSAWPCSNYMCRLLLWGLISEKKWRSWDGWSWRQNSSMRSSCSESFTRRSN